MPDCQLPDCIMFAAMVASLGAQYANPALAQEEITFPAADDARVYSDRNAYHGDRSRGTALLFHDEVGNAHEYAEIAPRLAGLGFEAVAVGTRTGADMYGGTNRTLAGLSSPPSFYDDGLQDVRADQAWARHVLPEDPTLLWGSGPSADMVIVTGADDPTGIAGVLAFSPFSMLLRSDEAEAAARLTVPLFVSYGTTPDNELTIVSKMTEAAPPDLLTLHTPEVGSYGVVTVVERYNPKGWEANWAAVEEFLDRVAP